MGVDLHQQSSLILIVELDIAYSYKNVAKGCGFSKILVSNPTNALLEPKLCDTTIYRIYFNIIKWIELFTLSI